MESRVWSYGVRYRCGTSLPLDTAVFSRFDGGGYGPPGSAAVVPPPSLSILLYSPLVPRIRVDTTVEPLTLDLSRMYDAIIDWPSCLGLLIGPVAKPLM